MADSEAPASAPAESDPTFITEAPSDEPAASLPPADVQQAPAPAKQTTAPQAIKEFLPKVGIKLAHDIVLEPQELDREAPYAQYTKTHAKYSAAIAAL